MWLKSSSHVDPLLGDAVLDELAHMSKVRCSYVWMRPSAEGRLQSSNTFCCAGVQMFPTKIVNFEGPEWLENERVLLFLYASDGTGIKTGSK